MFSSLLWNWFEVAREFYWWVCFVCWRCRVRIEFDTRNRRLCVCLCVFVCVCVLGRKKELVSIFISSNLKRAERKVDCYWKFDWHFVVFLMLVINQKNAEISTTKQKIDQQLINLNEMRKLVENNLFFCIQSKVVLK